MTGAREEDRAPSPGSGTALAERFGHRVFRTAIVLWWIYLATALLLGAQFGGLVIGRAAYGVALLAGIAVAVVTPIRRLAPHRLLDLGLMLLVSLAAVGVADTVYTMRQNATRQRAAAAMDSEARFTDSTVWQGELMPPLFSAPGQRFVHYKPNQGVSAVTYGEYYHPTMLRSPLLRDSVLERRAITYTIGPHGLRELEPLAGTRIFALGDSYVFGYGTTEGRIWPDLLGQALGEPVYNLGVSSTGPRHQLELWRHMLTAHADSMKPELLLWMIFEGNDLENDYLATPTEGPAATAPVTLRHMLSGTVLEALASLPGRVRHQSVLGRLVRGELSVGPSAPGRATGRLEVDGVRVALPLFASSRWGRRFFHPDDVARAAAPESYVRDHPNRPRLDATFAEMRTLAEQHGFRVVVITAPSDARLYGAAFDDFPPPSAQPYFVQYVLDLAARSGFGTIDLLSLMRPEAERALLYYRDDHHWNEAGNALAAQLIHETLANARP